MNISLSFSLYFYIARSADTMICRFPRRRRRRRRRRRCRLTKKRNTDTERERKKEGKRGKSVLLKQI